MIAALSDQQSILQKKNQNNFWAGTYVNNTEHKIKLQGILEQLLNRRNGDKAAF